MNKYYWENPCGIKPDCGEFLATDDNSAKQKMPKTTIVMYKESQSETGTPFIIVYKNKAKLT